MARHICVFIISIVVSTMHHSPQLHIDRKSLTVPGKPRRVTMTASGEGLQDIFPDEKHYSGHHSHQIVTSRPLSICWITNTQLAIFSSEYLEIHQISPEQTRLIHKQTCDDWKKPDSGISCIVSIAKSDALPNKLFLTCSWRPQYLYQIECFLVLKKMLITKCKITPGNHGNKVCRPSCIAANSNSVAILFDRLITSLLLVCNLPDLQHQRIIRVGFIRYKQIAMTNDLLVLLNGNELTVKSLSNLKPILSKVHAPCGSQIINIVLSKDGLELYIACNTDKDSSSVYKYRCICYGTPSYYKTNWRVDCGFPCQNGLAIADCIALVDSKNELIQITNLNPT